MINRKKHIFFLILIALLVQSCAMFSKKRFRKNSEYLTENNIKKLSGNYTFHPVKRISNSGSKKPNDEIPDSLVYNNAYDFMLNMDYKSSKKFDSIRNSKNDYTLNLELENSNRLRIKILENTKVLKDTFLSGKYKKGMFYLDNKYLKCHGVPYLFGGCSNNKRRIGITKNGNLLINEAVSNDGAFLIIFAAGYSYNSTYEYKRK